MNIVASSTAWHESLHCAALLSLDHVPLECRCDWPFDREVGGRTRRRLGHVRPDPGQPASNRTYALATLAAMDPLPVVAPEPNGSGDDEDVLAGLVGGLTVEEFLRLRFEARDLCRSKRFRRLAVAVYEWLSEVEVLNQDDLREIYEHERERETATCSS